VLRYCATSRKVKGLSPNGVIGIFHSLIPSGHTMVLRSTQTLKEISMSCLSWGQRRPVRSADNLATFLFRLSRNFGSLNLLELRARPGLERDCFYPFNKTLEGPKTSMNSGERNISVLSKNRMRIRRSSIPWTVVSYNNLCRYMSDR